MTYCATRVVKELFKLLNLYTPLRKFPTVFQGPSSKFGGLEQHMGVIFTRNCTFVSTDDVEGSRPCTVFTCSMCVCC
jgi:hypothetical protein